MKERENADKSKPATVAPVEGGGLLSAFSLIRKTSSVKKTVRSESVYAAIPFSGFSSFLSSLTTFWGDIDQWSVCLDKLEGALEYRQVKGGTAKWKKVYGNVIDLRLYIFEKADHKDNKLKAIANFDIK